MQIECISGAGGAAHAGGLGPLGAVSMIRRALTTYPPTRTGLLQTRTHLDVDLVVGTLLRHCHILAFLSLMVARQVLAALQLAVLFISKPRNSQLRSSLAGEKHTPEYRSHARGAGRGIGGHTRHYHPGIDFLGQLDDVAFGIGGIH